MDKQWKVVPVERSYDMRVKALMAFNTAQRHGKDRDVALDAAFQAMLDAAPLPPSASDEREGKVFAKHTCGGAMSRNPHADAGKPGHTLTEGCVYECIPCTVKSRHEWSQRALKAETALREHAASNTEPVAVVGEGFALFWAGSGPIAPLIERHGLKVGSRLYSRPAPSPGVDAAEQKPGTVAWVQNGIADFIADNWPMRKHTLPEIEAGIRAIEIRMPLDPAAPSPATSTERPADTNAEEVPNG